MTPPSPADPDRTSRALDLFRSPRELLNERIELLAEVIPRDARILEIGPLSVLSSLALAEVAMPKGRVVATYTSPVAATAVRQFLAKQPSKMSKQIKVVEVDHYEYGAPEYAPGGYAAVVAWGAWQRVPDAWVKQTVAGGRLLVSMYVAPLMDATALCCITCARDGGLGLRLLPGEPSPYDLLAWEPLRPYIDGITDTPSGDVNLVSGRWLRPPGQLHTEATVNGQQASVLLDRLNDEQRHLRTALWWGDPSGRCLLGERRPDFRVWSLLTGPDSLTTACFGSLPGWFGCADPDGVALVHTASGAGVTAGRHQRAAERLAGLVADWRAANRPGWGDLCSRLVGAPDGWRLEVDLPAPTPAVQRPPPTGITQDPGSPGQTA